MDPKPYIKNGNESAYPTFETNPDTYHGGLTKREEFAKAAMQGILAGRNHEADLQDEVLVRWAIEIADELLKQLEKE